MLARTLAPLVDFLYPPRCPLCGEGVQAQSGLCAACWGQLRFPTEPACTRCQLPLTREGAALCQPCRVQPPLHDGVAAGVLYNDAARALVLAYKHGHRIALAPMLARLMAARLGELPGEWLAVPVPLHRWRLWSRGYNQSALLARELARLKGTGLLVDGLERHKATPLLGELGREARAQVLAGAIRANPQRAAQISGAQVLLVDDVLTSGATTNACIAALRQTGVAKVRIACFARVAEEGF